MDEESWIFGVTEWIRCCVRVMEYSTFHFMWDSELVLVLIAICHGLSILLPISPYWNRHALYILADSGVSHFGGDTELHQWVIEFVRFPVSLRLVEK